MPQARGGARIAVVAVGALLLGVPASDAAPGAARSRATPAGATARVRVGVDVYGPLAVVAVARPLLFEAAPPGAARAFAALLPMPEDARLLDVTLRDGARTLRFRRGAAGPEADLEAGMRAAGFQIEGPPPVEAGVRVVAAGVVAPAAARLEYSFVAPLACVGGTFRLRLPPLGGAGEIVALRGIAAGPGGRLAADVAIDLPLARARAPTDEAAAAGVGSVASLRVLAAAGRRQDGERVMAAAACREGRSDVEGGAPSARAPYGAALFLVDRSRSVGAEGLRIEAAWVGAFVAALPAESRINVVLFDRTARTLFPAPRIASVEAGRDVEAALRDAVVANGTDWTAPLAQAAAQAALLDPGMRTLIVGLTDGALPDSTTREQLAAGAGALDPSSTDLAVLAVRPPGEMRAPEMEGSPLAALAARLGGALRVVPSGQEPSVAAARALLAALAAGGDAIDLAVADGAGGHVLPLSPSLAPGQGVFVFRRWPVVVASAVAPAPAWPGRAWRWSGALAGRSLSAPLRPVSLPPGVARALGEPSQIWLASGRGGAAFLHDTRRASTSAAARPYDLGKDVLHNSLTLGYLPRARACYLARTVRGPDDLRLEGRVRLELTIERGEIHDAAVRASTLGRPDIESCLREAAFSVEVPRVVAHDAPTVATLNLVFRPASRAEARPDDSALQRRLDEVVGPGKVSRDDELELLLQLP